MLIIDDDRDFVTAIAALLESAGYRLSARPTAAMACSRPNVHRPDLILLDVMMTERTEGFFTVAGIPPDPGLEPTPR